VLSSVTRPTHCTVNTHKVYRVIVILLVALLHINVSVLPSYTPAVIQQNQQEMAVVLRQYVAQGIATLKHTKLLFSLENTKENNALYS
jgi:hypothetical protein